MTSLAKDSVITAVAVGSLALVLIGGVYYLLPNWADVDGGAVEDDVVSLLTSPFRVAVKLGGRLGGDFMKSVFGFTYTAGELQ